MTTLTIHQRLFKAQEELIAIEKTKPKDGKFYEFTSHDDVTKAVKEVFLKHGILCIDDIIDADFKPVEVTKWDNYNKCEKVNTETFCTIKMQVHLINVDDPKDMITKHSYGQGVDNSDKAYGKAVSYAFKYALLKGLMAKTGLDSDETQDIKSVKEPVKQQPKPTAAVKKDKYQDYVNALNRVSSQDNFEWVENNIEGWFIWCKANYNNDVAAQSIQGLYNIYKTLSDQYATTREINFSEYGINGANEELPEYLK